MASGSSSQRLPQIPTNAHMFTQNGNSPPYYSMMKYKQGQMWVFNTDVDSLQTRLIRECGCEFGEVPTEAAPSIFIVITKTHFHYPILQDSPWGHTRIVLNSIENFHTSMANIYKDESRFSFPSLVLSPYNSFFSFICS